MEWRRSPKGGFLFRSGFLLVFVLLFLALRARGEEPLRQAVTVFGAQGADVNLREIPREVVNQELVWENAHFIGFNYLVTFFRTADFKLFPLDYRVKGLRIEAEGQLTKHWGLQNNYETHAALLVRTPDFNPFLDFGINVAVGNGFSYAFSEPSYEDGPGGKKGGRRFRLQNYIGIEMALGWLTYPHLRFVSRIHHRSGIYGVVAPQGVGSNFFAFGLRWRF